jgi:VanZ family protein
MATVDRRIRRLPVRAIRVVATAYWLLLTVLLLAPDPFELLGMSRPTDSTGRRVEHFALFVALALLVCASRLRMRGGGLAGLLVAYALITESLQGFIPTRSLELLDYLENLLGLAVGGAIWWWLRRWFLGSCPTREGCAEASELSCDAAGRERRHRG